MDEPACTSQKFLEKLEASFEKFESFLKKELKVSCERLENKLKSDFVDNASKTSSGYDEAESTDDEQEAERRASLHVGADFDDEDDNDILIISDDEDYNEIWEIDSQSSEEGASSDEGICSICRHKKQKITFFKILKTLPMYPPSEEIKLAKDENFTSKALQECHTEVIKTFLADSKLHQENINPVFKMLLEIEDITCMSEYPPLAQKDVILNCTGMAREYWISLKDCPNIDDIVAPFMDEAVLVPKASSRLSEVIPLKYKTDLLLPHEHESSEIEIFRRRIATVQQISKERAYFRFSKDEHLSPKQVASLVDTKYDVIFRPRRYPLRYQHRAMELLAESEDIRHYLFPKVNPFKDFVFQPQLEYQLFNTTIASNPEQLEAVHYITEGPNSHAPFVIFGPPGTGKTTTTVEAILQVRLLQPGSRILVTAGSNSACDTIALRICKYFKSNTRLQRLQLDDPENQKSLIRIYSKSIVEKGLELLDDELLENSNCKTGLHHYPSVKEIRQYGIIVATMCTVGKLVTGDVGHMNFFTHIFMDEAGASTEPEALVGIMGIKSDSNCRVILSGDHKQLGPILRSERAAQLGLERSLMERLMTSDCYALDDNCNYDRTIQTRLKRNYRSHPEIVGLYNRLYYDNELIAEAKDEDINMAAKWSKLPNPKFPIIFQAVHGVTEKDTITPSSYNNLEIQVLMWFLQRLLVDGIDGKKVEQNDIGVITPYKVQNRRIQHRLNDRGWSNVESGSVETFQGREKQIIIVSLVRSFAGLGFVRNPKRLNVILSRPKSLLILMGNPLTLRRHPDFAFIIEECKKHGTFLRKKKNKKVKNNLPRKSISFTDLSTLALSKSITTKTNLII